MSTAYDQRQRYRIFLAPDQGPIISVEIDGQRVSAARMMSDESAVDEIIRQIRNESRSRDQTSGLHFDDPRARGSLKSILNHMQIIHRIAGIVAFIPGSTPGDTAGGSQRASGSSPEEIQRIEDTWRKKVEALTRQHEQDITYLQRDHKEALDAMRRQAQTQIDNARNRVYSLETERDQAHILAAELQTELGIAKAAGRQGNEELKAEVIRLTGLLTEKEGEIAQLTAELNTARQQEEDARRKERSTRDEARLLRGKIARMKEDERKRQESNMQKIGEELPDPFLDISPL